MRMFPDQVVLRLSRTDHMWLEGGVVCLRPDRVTDGVETLCRSDVWFRMDPDPDRWLVEDLVICQDDPLKQGAPMWKGV